MEGTKAGFAMGIALLALAPCGAAAAEGPLDPAAVQVVQHQAGALVAPAQPVTAVVQGITARPAPVAVPTVAPLAFPKATSKAAAQPVATHAPVATRVRAPVARKAAKTAVHAVNPGSPPHGQEAMPAARSHRGRARAASPAAKPAAPTSPARNPAGEEAGASPPLRDWKPRNPLLGLGRPVRNATALIELGWLLTLVAGGCLGGRTLVRRLRAS